MICLHEKENWEPISFMKQLGKMESLHSWNSLIKISTFSQTDSVVEMNKLTSKLQSSNSFFLKNSIFCKLIQSMKWSENTKNFGEPIQSMRKWVMTF